MRRTIVLGAAFLCVLAVTPAWMAHAQKAQTGKGEQELEAVTDAQFVKMASAMDLAEISLGKLAQENANSADIKMYGKRITMDHMKSSKELLMIANKLGLLPASQMDAKHEALLDKLAKLKGQAFDQAFVKDMTHDHHKAIALYRSEAKNSKDASLRAFAEKTLPVLQEHLKMAERLSGNSGTGTKGQ